MLVVALHGVGQLLYRGGRLLERTGLLLGARGQVGVAGGDLLRGAGDRFAALAHLPDDADQACAHLAQGTQQLCGLVAPGHVDAPAEVAIGHPLRQGDRALQRLRDRTRDEDRQHHAQAERQRAEPEHPHACAAEFGAGAAAAGTRQFLLDLGQTRDRLAQRLERGQRLRVQQRQGVVLLAAFGQPKHPLERGDEGRARVADATQQFARLLHIDLALQDLQRLVDVAPVGGDQRLGRAALGVVVGKDQLHRALRVGAREGVDAAGRRRLDPVVLDEDAGRFLHVGHPHQRDGHDAQHEQDQRAKGQAQARADLQVRETELVHSSFPFDVDGLGFEATLSPEPCRTMNPDGRWRRRGLALRRALSGAVEFEHRHRAHELPAFTALQGQLPFECERPSEASHRTRLSNFGSQSALLSVRVRQSLRVDPKGDPPSSRTKGLQLTVQIRFLDPFQGLRPTARSPTPPGVRLHALTP